MSSPTGGPPKIGDSGVVDLGALRDQRADDPNGEKSISLSGEAVPFHANDIQPSVDTDGTVILTFRFLGQDGASDGTAVAVPAGVLVAFMKIIPAILTASIERYAKQAEGLGRFVSTMAGIAQQADAVRRSGPPTDLGDRRGG